MFQSIDPGLRNKRLIEWTKMISLTGSAQLLVQAIGLGSGILVIRLLSTQEYALYTIANTMIGTMIVLVDSGISTGVMANGGKVFTDRSKLGIVVASGMKLRRNFAIAALTIALPILFYLLIKNRGGYLQSILLTVSVVPAFLGGVTGAILSIPPKLHQKISILQKNQVELNIIRLIALVSGLFLMPWSIVAIIASGIPQLWANFRLKKHVDQLADLKENSDPDISKKILELVKKILPVSIYFCISGQVTVWIASIWGSASAIAQIGALSRLAMALNLFTVLFNTLVTPRYARLEDNYQLLLKRYCQIQLGLVVLTSAIVGFTILFPSQILWILGADYSNLQYELILSIAGTCISILAGVAFSLSSHRGWAMNSITAIAVNLFSIVVCCVIFDITTLKGVLYLNIGISGIQLLMNNIFAILKIRSLKI